MRPLLAMGILSVSLAISWPIMPAFAETADQSRRIANGETVTWVEESGGALKTCVAIGIIDCPPAKVYRAMTDFANYPKVFHILSTARVLKLTSTEAQVAYTMSPPWPITERKVTTAASLNAAAHTISFRAIAGNVPTYDGVMTAAPWGTNKTKFTYRTRIDPGIPLLPGWAITWGTRTSLPSVVRDLGNYAKHLP